MSRRQACSAHGCQNPAAFTTRTKPAWCLHCIEDILRTGGLTAAEPFASPKVYRLTTCLTCGVQAHYLLDYVTGNNGAGLRTCRACHWLQWAATARANRPDLDLQHQVLDLLRQISPEQILAADPHPDVVEFIQTRWWSPQRIAAHLDTYGYDLVQMVVAVNDGNDPVITRCRACQRVAADRLTDIRHGCTCSRNIRSRTPTEAKPARTLLIDSGSTALNWWDHDANAEAVLRTATVNGTRQCHWICPDCGCRFQNSVRSMTERPGCPDCAQRGSDEWSQSYEQYTNIAIADVPELATAWADEADPRLVMVGDWGMRKFRCANGHSPRIGPYRFLTAGCPHCQAKVTRTRKKWLADTLPEIASQWHPDRNGRHTPATVVWNSQRLIWWKADCCGHEWQESVRSRDKYLRQRCPLCVTILGSVAYENPTLAAEWSPANPLSAWHVRPNATTAFIPEWVCSTNADHIWWASLASRSAGSACPECRESGKSVVELAHHAAAVDVFGNARSGARLHDPAFTSRLSWTADICTDIGGHTLVIEYDGAYWHRDPAKTLVDERKSLDLLAAGHLLVRLREDDLPALPITHPSYLELRVYSTAPRPDAVLAKIRDWVTSETDTNGAITSTN